jgi:hypothetical protein
MIFSCILFSILLCGVYGNYCMFSNYIKKQVIFGIDDWSITGYKPSYAVTWDRLVGYDNLIDIKSITNKSDKNRWYFRSPPVIMPKLLSFTLTGYAGRFDKLNDDLEPVRIINNDVKHVFSHIKFNGTTTNYYVQFLHDLWSPPLQNTYSPVFIEILGDWTQGNETVGLSNVIFYQGNYVPE